MTDLRTAAQQALKILELEGWGYPSPKTAEAITALKAALVEDAMQKFTDVNQELEAALAEPVQEPVAWKDKIYETLYHQNFGNSIPLYTAPPQRHLPDWISYDKTTDVLNIHGKKYAAAIFGEEGFLSPTGTVLRVEQSQPETVTLTVVPQRKPLTEEEITQCFKDAGIAIKGQHWTNAVRNVERAHGIKE